MVGRTADSVCILLIIRSVRRAGAVLEWWSPQSGLTGPVSRGEL